MCSLPQREAPFCQETQSMVHENSHFLDLETVQIEPILVLICSPVALLFVPFPFYPLHGPQAEFQKTNQICVFLLQVASVDDLNHVSDIILMTASCMQPCAAGLLTYETGCESHLVLPWRVKLSISAALVFCDAPTTSSIPCLQLLRR